MSRKESRETAFKLVYERCVLGEKNPFSVELYTQDFSDADREYTERLYDGIDNNFSFLNSLVEKYSRDFKLERVYKVDLAALLIAAYEILFQPDLAYQISVNEAVELSKRYSTEKSYRFINGILSSLIKDKDELVQSLS